MLEHKANYGFRSLYLLTCQNVRQNIPTGLRTIDQYLHGGLSAGSISLVYGEAETGKTTLAMQCAVNCAKHGNKTLFVDCDNSFSVQRLAQISAERFTETAKLIVLARPNDFREQTAVLDRLAEYVTNNFGLAIIDTFTTLYRLRVAESPSKTFELNRELNRQLASLAQTVKAGKIAALITSQVHTALNEHIRSIEPVATRVLKFWANTVFALKPTENPGMVQMTLEKNHQKVQSKILTLMIEASGLHEY